MLTEHDLERLLARRSETRSVEFKRGIEWTTKYQDARLGIVKDIIAMANSQDGGVIIFGVDDCDASLDGVTEEQAGSFDVTKINDFLQNYTEPKHHCVVTKRILQDVTLVIVEVPEFPVEPIICKADGYSQGDSSKRILERGALYIRTDKATTEKVSTADEMRKLLGRSLQKAGDELLQRIQQLFDGRQRVWPDSDNDKYSLELSQSSELFNGTNYLGPHWKDYGSWQINAYPSPYMENRIKDHQSLKELIKNATVSLRGWDFPWTDISGNARNVANGYQSWIVSDRYIEGYRAFTSGLFTWRQALYEDIAGIRIENARILDPVMLILSLTEFVLFFKRYFGEMSEVDSVRYQILLNGTFQRILHPIDRRIRQPYGTFIAEERFVTLEGTVTQAELRADALQLASDHAKRVFAIFQQDGVTDQTIRNWQDKLLRRNLS